MFVSDSRAEVNGLAAFLEPGQRGWRVILKPQVSPWFHVTLVRCEEGFETRSVVFIDSVHSLISWMETGQDGSRVECLQLVSPAWLNGNQNWQMDELSEVAQSVQEGGVRFTLADGAVISFPDPEPCRGVEYSKVIYCLAS